MRMLNNISNRKKCMEIMCPLHLFPLVVETSYIQ